MTEQTILGGNNTPVTDQAVWVEPKGADSAIVRQRVRYENGEQVETETPFRSLSEALAYANRLCRDDSPENTETV